MILVVIQSFVRHLTFPTKKANRWQLKYLLAFYVLLAVVNFLFQHHEPIKIALIQTVLHDTILLILGLRVEFRLLCTDLTGAGQQLVAVELQKAVQTLCPVLHAHGDFPFCLQFGIVQIERHDALQIVHFLFAQVIFGHRHICFQDFSVRGILPSGKPHVFLVGIGPLIDQLCRRVAMHGIVHLVLDGLEEQPGRLGILVVIERRSIQVCHFLVELALRQANLPDLLQLPLEESTSGFIIF